MFTFSSSISTWWGRWSTLTKQIIKMSTYPQYNFKNLAGAADTLVQKNSGVLHTVTINTTAASGIVLYDGTSSTGTKIATIAASPVIGSTFTYDVRFTNGLFVSMGGASDVTLSIG